MGMESSSRSGQRNDKDSSVRAWGGDIMDKKTERVRVGAINIGGLPSKGHGAKLEEIRV